MSKPIASPPLHLNCPRVADRDFSASGVPKGIATSAAPFPPTYWTRCDNGGGGGGGDGHRRRNLEGTWYRDGNRSYACSINQRGSNLTFTNEQGATAQGKFLGNKNVTANWNGQTINGTLVKNGGQINWDNGTMWSR